MACSQESAKNPLCFRSTDCALGQSCDNTVCVAKLQGVLPSVPEFAPDTDAGHPEFLPEFPAEPPPGDPNCGPPTLEECNNYDDDCNGQIDDNLTRACPTNQSGICSTGRQTCDRGVWGHCIAPQPEPEVCDGKDNNCNGLIDDGITGTECYTGPASTKGKGLCKTGRSQCQNGVSTCRGETLPSPELCGDAQDNNCNGLIDETCGEKQNLWITSQNASVSLNRGFSTGMYIDNLTELYYKLQPSGFSCEKDRVLLVSPYTRSTQEPIATSYECSNEWFKIHTYRHKKSTILVFKDAVKADFQAVSPLTGSWGRILCAVGLCKVDFTNHPNPVIVSKGNGLFSLKYTSDYCQKPGDPVLGTMFGTSEPGYISGRSLGNGECEIQTFTREGTRFAQSFVFWIPVANKDMAWATVSTQGKILASHTFGDPINQWPVQPATAGQKVSVYVHDPNKAKPNNPKFLFLAAPQLKASSLATTVGMEWPITTTLNAQDVVVRTYKQNTHDLEFSSSAEEFFLLLIHAP